MRSRKKLLQQSRLYLLIDKRVVKTATLGFAKRLAQAGVDIIQLRDKSPALGEFLKDAHILSKALKKTRTLFIVNDYLDIALLSDSDGVHLGQSDIPVKEARRLLGQDKIIGVSCSNLKEALRAQKEGADYIGFGPIFKTSLKPGVKAVGLNWIKDLKRIRVPIFAIGDINSDNLSKFIALGIRRVALCRGILQAKDKVKTAAYFAKKLKSKNDSIRMC